MKGRRRKPRVNDAAGTRRRLLEAAASEIYANGFHAVSVEQVLRSAGVTKGALYHHFEGKGALAQAMVTEILGGHVRAFVKELSRAPDPARALAAWVEGPPWADLRKGCPLNNLAQEMASVDETFRRRIEAVFAEWRGGIAAALRRGRGSGVVRRGVDPEAAACFILASLEGSYSLAKSAQDPSLFVSNMKLLSGFIQGLRGPSH